MSQVIVQAEHLNLSYKTVHAVQNVSLSVELGEILAVIGCTAVRYIRKWASSYRKQNIP